MSPLVETAKDFVEVCSPDTRRAVRRVEQMSLLARGGGKLFFSDDISVTKGWWDLDDWNNEAGSGAASGDDDRLAYETTPIIRGWRQFDDGSDNREDGESGQDGVNMRDYWANNSGRFTASGAFETLVEHNCLQDQDNN